LRKKLDKSGRSISRRNLLWEKVKQIRRQLRAAWPDPAREARVRRQAAPLRG
jgi:hypothetical protein